MANYGPEITNYYAPYRYQGPPSIVGGSGSGGKKKSNAVYLSPEGQIKRRQAGGDMYTPNPAQQALSPNGILKRGPR